MALIRMGSKVVNLPVSGAGRRLGQGCGTSDLEGSGADGRWRAGGSRRRSSPFPAPRLRPGRSRRSSLPHLARRGGLGRIARGDPRPLRQARSPTAALLFAGEVVECRMSRAGWLLAQMGAADRQPAAASAATPIVPAMVSVTEDAAGGGQHLDPDLRAPARLSAGDRLVQDASAGPTGLEEHIGGGVRHRAPRRGRGRRAAFRQRPLFPRGRAACGCAFRAGSRPARCRSAISTAITACSPSCCRCATLCSAR